MRHRLLSQLFILWFPFFFSIAFLGCYKSDYERVRQLYRSERQVSDTLRTQIATLEQTTNQLRSMRDVQHAEQLQKQFDTLKASNERLRNNFFSQGESLKNFQLISAFLGVTSIIIPILFLISRSKISDKLDSAVIEGDHSLNAKRKLQAQVNKLEAEVVILPRLRREIQQLKTKKTEVASNHIKQLEKETDDLKAQIIWLKDDGTALRRKDRQAEERQQKLRQQQLDQEQKRLEAEQREWERRELPARREHEQKKLEIERKKEADQREQKRKQLALEHQTRQAEAELEKAALERVKQEREKAILGALEKVDSIPLPDFLRFFRQRFDLGDMHDAKAATHTELLDHHKALLAFFQRNHLVEPQRQEEVEPDVRRLNQIETVIDLYSEKIRRVKTDEDLDEEERQMKIEYWVRLRDREVQELEN